MADNPAWPNQPLLHPPPGRGDGRPSRTTTPCSTSASTFRSREVPSMLRCATADAAAGRAPDAAETARLAWMSGIVDAPAELAFLRQWGKVLTPADQWRRFDRLAWTDTGAVGGPAWRQLARLDPGSRPVGEARLALKRDDPSARALVAALPGGAAVDPGLVLDLAKWLRRAGQGRRRRPAVAGDGPGRRARDGGRPAARLLGRAQPAGAPPAARRGRGRRLRAGGRRPPTWRRSRRSTRSSWPASSRCGGATTRMRRSGTSARWPA